MGNSCLGLATDWLSVTSPDKGNNKNNCDHAYRWGISTDNSDGKHGELSEMAANIYITGDSYKRQVRGICQKFKEVISFEPCVVVFLQGFVEQRKVVAEQAEGDVLQEDLYLCLRINRVCKKVPKSCLLVVLMLKIVGLLQLVFELMEERVCVCVWEG